MTRIDECHCDCHKEGMQIVHVMPCCTECENCGLRIVPGFMKSHLKECHDTSVKNSDSKTEIPEISDSMLQELIKKIRPVISLRTTPLGRYPIEEVCTYYLKLPKLLRKENFLNQKRAFSFRSVRLVEEGKIQTLHIPGSMGRIFHPTIAEVFAQIPESYLRKDVPSGRKIVAFETFLEKNDPEYQENTGLHIATTVLLSKGSKVSGTMRHYSS